MKNKRTFLASLALGLFLLATVAPIVTADNDKLGIEKKSIITEKRK